MPAPSIPQLFRVLTTRTTSLCLETRISPYSLIEIIIIRIRAMRCQSSNVLVAWKSTKQRYRASWLWGRIRSMETDGIAQER